MHSTHLTFHNLTYTELYINKKRQNYGQVYIFSISFMFIRDFFEFNKLNKTIMIRMLHITLYSQCLLAKFII